MSQSEHPRPLSADELSLPADEREQPAITPGRCGSCVFLECYSLPLNDIYFCRRLVKQMTPKQKDRVQGCPAWEGEYSKTDDQGKIEAGDIYADTSPLYADLRDALAQYDVDLKTMVLLAHPALKSVEQVSWIDKLPSSGKKRNLLDLADLTEALISRDLAALVRIAAERLGKID